MRAQGCGVGPFKYLSRVSLWGHKKKGGKKFFFSLFGLALGLSRLSDFFYIFESFYATNSKRKEKKNLGRRSGPKINPKIIQKKKKKKNSRDFVCVGVPRRREQERQRERETQRDTERDGE